jgi:L,D-peptidoglycan transpeptidase YkuD (ErfK/YbiS/YcfS/YnhG family)
MIIINESGFLKYKNLKVRCALGKAGIKKKNKEGDNITPRGNYKIVDIYYRKDRIKKIFSKFKIIQIKKNMGWCDDPKSKKYNQLIRLPSKNTHEKLFRKDSIYDLIIVLDFNTNPIIKNKGSAIFVHVAKPKYKKTAGCVALKKNHLIELIKTINKRTKISIC